jgi:hypothetical protein
MFQESIKVSLIAVSVEQLIYLLITRCCFMSFLPILFRDTPVHLEDRTILTKTDVF